MPPDDDLKPAFEKLLSAAAGLPGVEAGTSYGTPALRVGKKLLCRVKDAGSVVLMAPLEEKEMLLAAMPDVYFETDHYKGWPVLLAHIDLIGDDELAHRLAVTWRRLAPRKLLKAAGAAQPPAP
ncbi:MAG: MmcQ/YjbR family DNA-binding protein [Mesorhizobium sp.]